MQRGMCGWTRCHHHNQSSVPQPDQCLCVNVQAKTMQLLKDVQTAREAEQAAVRHWEIERDAVKCTLQQLEDEQSRSRQQHMGLAQANAQTAVSNAYVAAILHCRWPVELMIGSGLARE